MKLLVILVKVEETVLTPGGNKLFLAGGAGHGGVGKCISRQFCCQMRELTFHAFNFRLCSLKFTFGNKKFMVFACYFPTTWMPDETVFEMYGLLNFVVADLRARRADSSAWRWL